MDSCSWLALLVQNVIALHQTSLLTLWLVLNRIQICSISANGIADLYHLAQREIASMSAGNSPGTGCFWAAACTEAMRGKWAEQAIRVSSSKNHSDWDILAHLVRPSFFSQNSQNLRGSLWIKSFSVTREEDPSCHMTLQEGCWLVFSSTFFKESPKTQLLSSLTGVLMQRTKLSAGMVLLPCLALMSALALSKVYLSWWRRGLFLRSLCLDEDDRLDELCSLFFFLRVGGSLFLRILHRVSSSRSQSVRSDLAPGYCQMMASLWSHLALSLCSPSLWTRQSSSPFVMVLSSTVIGRGRSIHNY